MSDEIQSQQYPPQQPVNQPPTLPKKNLKMIALAAVAVVVVIALVAAALLMSGPGIPGKWEKVSVKATLMVGGNTTVEWDNSTGDWIQFNTDGTGLTSDGDVFEWDANDGRMTITGEGFGTMGVPFDYTLNGDKMTIRGMFSAGLYMVITLNRM